MILRSACPPNRPSNRSAPKWTSGWTTPPSGGFVVQHFSVLLCVHDGDWRAETLAGFLPLPRAVNDGSGTSYKEHSGTFLLPHGQEDGCVLGQWDTCGDMQHSAFSKANWRFQDFQKAAFIIYSKLENVSSSKPNFYIIYLIYVYTVLLYDCYMAALLSLIICKPCISWIPWIPWIPFAVTVC